jgi:hypothetical protein
VISVAAIGDPNEGEKSLNNAKEAMREIVSLSKGYGSFASFVAYNNDSIGNSGVNAKMMADLGSYLIPDFDSDVNLDKQDRLTILRENPGIHSIVRVDTEGNMIDPFFYLPGNGRGGKISVGALIGGDVPADQKYAIIDKVLMSRNLGRKNVFFGNMPSGSETVLHLADVPPDIEEDLSGRINHAVSGLQRAGAGTSSFSNDAVEDLL